MASIHGLSVVPKTLTSCTSTFPKPSFTSQLHLHSPLKFKTQSYMSFNTSPFNSRASSVLIVRAAISDEDYSAKRSSSSSNNNEPKETIMLPGCDYNHWLIVMEFPKDPAPTREQMIETYLNTLATVLGSMEEAKKNLYALSTTTYTGFQCTVSEETSEKFKGLPGVLWVLPDSYLDVKNKDYGGDKYINGEIIPCTLPTYNPKQPSNQKYGSRKYVRQRDGPPRAKPKQTAAPSESSS